MTIWGRKSSEENMNNLNYNILEKVIHLNWSSYMVVVGLGRHF